MPLSTVRRRAGATLLALLLGTAVLAPALLLVRQQSAAEQELLALSEARMRAIDRITGLAVEGLLRTSKDVLNAQVARPETLEAFAQPPGADRDAALSALTDALQRADSASTVSFAVEPDGTLRRTSPPNPQVYGEDFAYRDWYRGALAQYGPYVSEGYRTRAEGEPLVVGIARAVRGPDGAVVGLLGTTIDLRHLQALVDAQTGLTGLSITVVDRYDQVLARTGGLVSEISATTEQRLRRLPPGSGPRSGRPSSAESGDVWAAVRLAGDEGAVLVEVPGRTVTGDLPAQQRTSRLALAVTVLVLAGAGAVTARLVTARLQAQRSLRASETRLRGLLETVEAQRSRLAFGNLVSGVGHYTIDPVTTEADYSDEVLALFGMSPHDPRRHDGQLFREQVLHPDDEPELVRRLTGVVERGGTDSAVLRATRLDDGRQRFLRVTVARDRLADGTLAPVVRGGMIDVTPLEEARRAAEDAGALHRALLSATPDVLYLSDVTDAQVLWVSDGVTGILGCRPDALVGPAARWAGWVHPDDLPVVRLEQQRVTALADGEVAVLQFRMRGQDGWVWVNRRATPFRRDASGRVVQVLGTVRDVTESVEAQERLRSAAERDALTGLPNRALLADRLAAALSRSRRSGLPVAVLLVDLDGFKRVNDTAGHAAGDALLVEVARRLESCVRDGDTVARLGGDEFVVLLEHGAEEELDAQTAAVVVARRVKDAVARAVVVDGVPHHVTASTGLAFSGAAHDDPEGLLADADAAMYRAKASGRDRFEVFEVALRAETERRAHVEQALRAALEARGPLPLPRSAAPTARLHVAFQPVTARSGTLRGFEALARLDDGAGHAVPPQEFVGVAEGAGLVGQLGAAVLDDALAACAAWRRQVPHLRVAVNVSGLETRDPGYVGQVRAALARHGLPPQALVLEVTESVLVETAGPQGSALRSLHALGVAIAIDDFGTGYASLRYLAELPVTSVKVDRSFVAGLPHDAARSAIVHAVAALAAQLGLACVAEGVETVEQLQALPPEVHVQGYLRGRPLPAAEVDLQARVAG